MASPTYRPSGISLPEGGPPSTFLKLLLDEINGTANPTILRNSTPKPQSTPRSAQLTPRSVATETSSVWVGGAFIAQDARQRLRAADEVRFCTVSSQGSDDASGHKPRLRLITSGLRPASGPQSKRKRPNHSESDLTDLVIGSVPAQIKRNHISASISPSTSRSTVIDMHLPSSSFNTTFLLASSKAFSEESDTILCNIDSDISTTPSSAELPTSAISGNSTEPTTASTQTSDGNRSDRRAWSGDVGRRVLTKEMRTMTLPGQQTQTAFQSNWKAFSSTDSVDDYRIVRNRILTTIERSSTFQSQNPRTVTQAVVPSPSSPELDTIILPSLARPSTPVHIPARTTSVPVQNGTPTPPDTPSFARPLQLIEADMAIYKHDHGEEWRDFPLCLYCFRQRGSFNRILTHGYEVCGGDYALRGHHWEATMDR